MFQYRAYGLFIQSEIALPELIAVPGTVPADITIRAGIVDPSLPPEASGGLEAWATPDHAFLSFEEAGRFSIQRGSEVVFDRSAGCEDRTARLFILGPVLGVLLHQRGFLVLHASSVAMAGGAIAFVAEKGTGKSTLAAAFHARGHGIVADDLVAVDVEAADGPIAHPGFPQLKLFPQAAAQLDANPDELPRLMPDFDKRARRVPDRFPDVALHLLRIYVLQDGDAERIEPLASQQAFIEIVRHSYALVMLRASGSESAHFRQAVRLTASVPVQRLVRRRSIDALPNVVPLVEADLAR